jgi:K+-sensing histidine kinase KdpD
MQRTIGPQGLAAVSVLVAAVMRWLLDPVLGDRHVFSLFFAAVAVSAWYGGVRPAFAALLAGWVAADWLFLPPSGSWFSAESLLYISVGLAIIGCTEGVRRGRRTLQVKPEANELLAVADAVRTHHINSRELVAYLEGLNASPETFIAAAHFEDFDLEPELLSERLAAMAHRGHATTSV